MAEYVETIEFGGDFGRLNKQLTREGKRIEAGLDKTFTTSLRRVKSLQEAMSRGTSGAQLFGRASVLRGLLGKGGSNVQGGAGGVPGMPALPNTTTPPRPRGGGGGKGGGGGDSGGLGGAVLGGVGATAVVAGVQALAGALHNVVESADAAANSKIFDVRTYGRLSAAAKKGQTDIATLDQTSSKLANTLAQSKLPPEFQRGLQAVAVDAKTLKGLAPEEQFALLADRINDFENPADQAAVAMKLFGEQGANLLPFLRQGSAGIKAAADTAEKYGAVLTTDAVEATKRYKDSLDLLAVRGEGFAISVGSKVLPVLADGADWFGRLADDVGPQLDDFLGRLGETFEWVGGLVSTASEYIGPVFTAAADTTLAIVDRVQGTLEGLGEQFGVASDGAEGLTVWLGESLVTAVDWVSEAFITVYDTIDPVVTIVGDLVALVFDLVGGTEDATGVFSGLTDAAIGLVDDALSRVQAVLEIITDLFDAFTEGTWEDAFLSLGNALLDFILEPLRSIVSTVVTVADAISEDLVPQSVRDFAQGGKIRTLAAEASEEKSTRRKESAEKRENAKREREGKRLADKEERARAAEEKALGIIGPKQEKIDSKRLAALKQTDAKLSGETLSLGARDGAGRMIELYLGAGDKVAKATRAKYAALANAARTAIVGRNSEPTSFRSLTTGDPYPMASATGGGAGMGRSPALTLPRVSTVAPSPSAPGATSTAGMRIENHFDIDVVFQGGSVASLDMRSIRTQFEKLFRERLGADVVKAQRMAGRYGFLT